MDTFIAKIQEEINAALGFTEDPDILCHKSRISCEAIMKVIWAKECGELTEKLMLDALLKGVVKNSPDLIPERILIFFGTVQRYGNEASHAQKDLEKLDKLASYIVQAAMTGICNWFFIDYLRMDYKIDFIKESSTNDQRLNNYKELIRACFQDKILNFDEYESIMLAKQNLSIDDEILNEIDREILLEISGKNINNLSEIVNTELSKDQRKLDLQEIPAWAKQYVLEFEQNVDENMFFKDFLSYYIDNVNDHRTDNFALIYNIIGSWQGWYSQGGMKTYFDFVFIATSKNTFTGISMEPVNSNWRRFELLSDQEILIGLIEGHIEDDILVSFNKIYLLENTWELKYDGVIIDNGKYFEGEWSVSNQNDSFSAMRTKSLFPIRIFDVVNKIPVAETIYLDNIQSLNATWFLQITGKDKTYAILHILEVRGQLKANLIYQSTQVVNFVYLEGEYQDVNKITLNEITTIDGEPINILINFNIDWISKQMNGTIKDDNNKLRSLKGFKL